ncbi:hypothetical protein JNB11_06455 [Kocuria palustris]|nr:hypothetical protein [Kocuria palustris]
MSSWHDDDEPHAARLVLLSLTSEREEGLSMIRTQLASDGDAAAAAALPVLLSTYNYYLDPHLRTQLVATLEAIVAHDSQYLSQVFQFVAQVSTAGLAVTLVLTLLSWVNHFLPQAAPDAELAKTALTSQARLVENIVAHCQGQTQKHLARIKLLAIHSSQMAVAALVLRNPQLLQSVSLDKMEASVGCCFLGLLARAPPNTIANDYIATAGEWYGNQVLLLKTAVPVLSLKLFGEFVTAYITADVFKTSILPLAEKAVLRLLELSWGTNLPPLFLACDFDMSVVLSLKLFPLMLTAMKLPKPAVVEGATAAATQVVLKTKEQQPKLIDEIAKTLKATLNVDAKRSIANLFTMVKTDDTPEVGAHLLDTLIPIIAKEQNEVLLEPLARVFCRLATTDAKYVAVIAKGLDDKKPQIKRVWLLAVTDASPAVVEQVKPQLQKVVDAAIDTPLPMVASKLMVGAFVALTITDYNPPKALGLLVNGDVYTKLSGDDLGPYIKALRATDGELEATKYADAWLWAMTSPQVDYQTRLQAVALAKEVANTHLWFSLQLIDLLKRALQTGTPEMMAKLVPQVLAMLTQLDSVDAVKQNTLALVVIANHAKVPVNNGWIGLLQRSRGANDIAKLVLETYQELLDTLTEEVFGESESLWHQALVKTIALLGFILPEPVVPELLSRIKNTYREVYQQLVTVDNDKIAIWQHQGPEPYVDVLAKGKPEDKNLKDYETRKWEELLKKDLKKKPTLTKEQQAQVKAQLEVEQSIRLEINQWVFKLKLVVAIYGALTDTAKLNVDNATAYWFPDAVSKLLQLAKAPHTEAVVGTQVVDTFLQLLELCTPKLAAIRQMLGVATLRTSKVAVSPAFSAEPLLSLVGRLLYRIKMVSDSQPLDLTTLTYCMPLLVQVLKIGYNKTVANAQQKKVVTSEFVDEDPEEEHLLLALDIIQNHASQFELAAHAQVMPRTPILEVVVALMKLPQRAKLAKETLTSLCHYIGISPLPEDLELLLSAVIVPEVYVKHAVLEAIDAEFDLHAEGLKFSPEVWIAVHDNDDAVAETAATVWQDSQFQLPEDALEQLLKFFGASDAGMRLVVARLFVNAVAGLKQPEKAVKLLLDHFRQYRDPPPPKKDAFGLVIKLLELSKDPWEHRHTVALALKMMADQVEPTLMPETFKFMIEESLLGDRHDEVRSELLNAAVDLITAQGVSVVDELSPIIEACLNLADKGLKEQDTLKELAIVCYGALAQHLDGAALFGVIDQLVTSLATPSEDVQVAIGKAFAPLVPKMGDQYLDYLDKLLNDLLDATKLMPVRRGLAYGMAGLVHGYGIKALAEFDIVRQLLDASDDKKLAERRESVAFAFECLSHALGKFFEPYVISEVLPVLLKQLGDMLPEVREATDYAARQIMKNTTSFGVKKLIPVAIRNLDEIAWRTKKGLVELLGNMAYLDPAQLLASLLLIIPEIVGVLNDTHKEVRKAADASLKKFGEVIRNPEIQAIVPALIDAIGDPTKHTETALDQLIHTQFVHYIDGPSLALIIHVIHRGMRDRSAAVKKKACQIVGNMAILVDAKDLEPYLNQLVLELEVAMVDPVPATRLTAARALGSLVEKLGEPLFPELIPLLVATLNDPERAGDRLGSAQALAEVICGLGIAKLEEMLPLVLEGALLPKLAVRAGFMPLLLYLPVCFGSLFAPYLNQTIPPILSGLADSDADVSDTALRAGRLIVNNYAKKAVDLLLPELERGLGDDNYRIRLSLVELTGDLLFQIAGISGKNAADSAGDSGADTTADDAVELALLGEVAQALIDALGQQRRDHVLALLFLCRSDVAGIVRAAAVDIWNALVGNTPKTVKQILPTLISIIVVRLALADDTHRKIAATCLGDTVRRVGANALAQMLPTLRANLDAATDSDAKQGICIATTELVALALDEALAQYQDVFVDIIKQAVIDDSPAVRAEAAVAFEALVAAVGKPAIDEIVPDLLRLMALPQRAQALAGLRDLMAAQAETIFPILLPTLLAPPMDAFKAQALAQVCLVAGLALLRRLGTIVLTLVEALVANPDDTAVAEALDAVLVAVDDDGAHALLQQLLLLVKHEDAAHRAAIYARLGNFFAHTQLDYSMYLSELVSQFVLSLGDRDPVVVQGTFEALSALVKAQPKEQLEKLVRPAAQALEMLGVRDCDLAGFALPKGPQCVLPIFSHGLMYGSSELKEVAARAIGDVIGKTPAANLKPFATTITGPLIRVIGEKVGPSVKLAILHALNALLEKIPQFLRPFVPQLQRTFVRLLSDPSSDDLRKRAVECLATLIKFQPRVDALVSELVQGVTLAPDQGVKTAMLQAMLAVVAHGGSNMLEQLKAQVLQLAQQEIGGSSNAELAVASAELMGAIAKVVLAEEAALILRLKVLDNDTKDKFGVLTVNLFLRYAPSHIFADDSLLSQIVDYVTLALTDANAEISENGTVAIGKLLLGGDLAAAYEDKVFDALAIVTVAPPSLSTVTRRLALVVIRTVARLKNSVVARHLDAVVPLVFASLRDRVIPIKLAAEKAYLAVFNLVEDEQATMFEQWFAGKDKIVTVTGAEIVPRLVGDYTKRVALRLATAEREKLAAGGDAEEMFSDQFEDEKEVWKVGV